MLAALIALFPGFVRADDVNRPPWYYPEHADNTYQMWEFSSSDLNPSPDGGKNIYAWLPATIHPAPSLDTPWLATDANSNGIWDLTNGGYITVPVIDDPTPRPEKRLWVQMTWLPSLTGGFPALTASTPVEGFSIGTSFAQTDPLPLLATGWYHSTFEIDIWPSPGSETLKIGGNILLDELVIDTYSTPEPATAALLVLGLVTLRRRR
jgi:hypothetical protein